LEVPDIIDLKVMDQLVAEELREEVKAAQEFAEEEKKEGE
jgi:hypothetical protein